MSGTDEVPEGDETPDLDTVAGEYVLGVLDSDQMAAVLAQARTDPALGAALSRWEAHLAPLTAAIPPVAPPPALWQRIEARIAPVPDAAANDDVLPAPRRAEARGWQAATAVGFALAAALAVVAFLPRPAPRPALVASIAPKATPAAFVAQVRPDGSVVLAAITPAPVPAGRDLELWELPPGARTVASLGVLPAVGRTLNLPALPPAGTQLLVSLEPHGGSPTGQPTGPVLYSGTLVRL